MAIRDEITSTSFRVVASETEPYSFHECAAQQVHSSVRITHITFSPPNAKVLDAYRQNRRKTNDDVTPATFARLRTLCATGGIESYIVACFPWSTAGDAAHSGAAGTLSPTSAAEGAARAGHSEHAHSLLEKGKKLNKVNDGEEEEEEEDETETGRKGEGEGEGEECVRLGGRFSVALPRQTDICRNVDLRLDVDGSVWLEVLGPGSVTLFGEQYSALIPEWLSHHFFNVGDDDEEEEEEENDADGAEEAFNDYEDERDIAEMYRLIH